MFSIPPRLSSRGMPFVLGVLSGTLAVLRALKGIPAFNPDKVDDVTIGLLALPVLLLTLREAQSFKVGRDGVEFTRRVEDKLDAASRELAATRAQVARVEQHSRAAQRSAEVACLALSGVGGRRATVVPATDERSRGLVLRAPDDVQRGCWGGSNEGNGRRLAASVISVAGTTEWFRVRLWVEALPGSAPLTNAMVFHLHPTFPEPNPVVMPVDGFAALERLTYGAFTAGVETDGGRTRLELDLATIEDAPPAFRASAW
jgi:hypothetical protein